MGFGNTPFGLKFIFHPSVRDNLSNFGKIENIKGDFYILRKGPNRI